MKEYTIQIEEPFSNLLEELLELLNRKNNNKITMDYLLEDLLIRGFAKAIDNLVATKYLD